MSKIILSKTIFLVRRESCTNILLAAMFPSKSFFCAWGHSPPTFSMESDLAGSLYYQTSTSMKRECKLHLGIQIMPTAFGRWQCFHIIYLYYGRSVPQTSQSETWGRKEGKLLIPSHSREQKMIFLSCANIISHQFTKSLKFS